MYTASITVDPRAVVAPVHRRLFGSFVEHLGRCVYGGIYDPEHSTADADGFRGDVLDLVRELGVTSVRYPGGNFVSGYRWEDAIGPVSSRPSRLDLAWHSTEPNLIGVDEFMRWARKAEIEPMMAVNLGTRGVQEAIDLLEYCNHHGGTHWSDLRRSNGAEDPYGITMWCLGNEMDGPWQIGHKTGREYGRLAAETARAMRMFDPGLTLVAAGSSSAEMDTFGSWEAEVLEETYDQVDMISAHSYYFEKDGDLQGFLASGARMDRFIEEIVASADHVRARLKARKRISISFDEWNVWYLHEEPSRPPTGTDWPVGPRLLEDRYSVADAVVVGGLLISLLKHADRVESASLAQLVNVIAPIMTEPGGIAWRQTTFHPFAQASAHAQGEVLSLDVRSPGIGRDDLKDVPVLDAVATHDGERTALFVVNRSLDSDVHVTVDLSSLGTVVPVAATTLTDSDLRRTVSATDAHLFGPQPLDVAWEGSSASAVLPRASWSVITLESQR